MKPKDDNRVGLVIPTLNAGSGWQSSLDRIKEQTLQPKYLLVIDSSSDDGTAALAQSYGLIVEKIKRSEFNHGATRKKATDFLSDAEIIIFMTQDAVLSDSKALENLVSVFEDPQIGAAYGRQLPRPKAGLLEAHARLYNYPPISKVKSLDDVPKIGIKAVFTSNSFAAYRRDVLVAVGNFPMAISSEDMYVATKMLLVGWKLAYCAEAQVYHSHDYSCLEEFKRYFDIGAFHAQESWIRERFGEIGGEGMRYVYSEIRYLLSNNNKKHIPSSILHNVFKFLGFKLGLMEKSIPLWLKVRFSMHKRYWLLPHSSR